jgi:hypothetical protein
MKHVFEKEFLLLLLVLGFEFQAQHSLGWCSTAKTTLQALFALVIFGAGCHGFTWSHSQTAIL